MSMTATTITRTIATVLVASAMALGTAAAPASAGEAMKFSSPEAALAQGRSTHRSGHFGMAESALNFAASKGLIRGRFFLARLYADPAAPFTSHPKAYELYRAIVAENAETIDVDDHPDARYVGQALTAYGSYMLRGLPEIGLKPNAERAFRLFEMAATFFRNQDGEFELAKLYLTGEGVLQNVRQATARLSTLSKNGHAPAQAFLADLYWRGKYLTRDERQALALVTVAVENAPPTERIWIEDTYHSIFCGLPETVRKQTEGLVASYRQYYVPRPGSEPQEPAPAAPGPVRACADGTPLPALQQDGRASEALPPSRSNRRTESLQGGMMDVGATSRPPR